MTTATAKTARKIGLVLTTALATALVAGCSKDVAPAFASSASKAESLLAKGKSDKAVTHAEMAVLASPRDAATRALLAKAYIGAGRFVSAATALEEAMQLGDTSGRTVLTYALTLSAVSRFDDAQTLLDRYERNLDPADFGLAITVAGRPQQGIQVLSNVLRGGTNTMQVRQNLAYAFALNGDWRSARLVAQQDLAANVLGERLGQWAVLSQPRMAAQRVAALLDTTVSQDAGQPNELALVNFPTTSQLALETSEAAAEDLTAEVASADAELPAFSAAQPYEVADAETPATAPVAVSRVAAAPRVVLPKPVSSIETVDLPEPKPVVVAKLEEPVKAAPSKAFAAAFVRKPGDYTVQLGSFDSAAIADGAWAKMLKRHPELKGSEKSVTKAKVDGKIFYRVAAVGFAKSSATELCGVVKKRGGGCFAYASARTLPGTISEATRVAQR